MKICVIFNPTARGEKANRFRERLGGWAAQCTLKPTLSAGAGRAMAAESVREGYEVIVAAGGDGTVNEVINGIGDEPDGLRHVRFGVLPLGTVIVFAMELGLPGDLCRSWAVILKGDHTAIDLPYAEFSAAGRNARRSFAQMAGSGLDSRAVERVSWEQKKRWGPLSYVFAFLKVLREGSPRIVVAIGDRTLTGELVLIGNGRFYGGKFPLFPKADWADGLLEVSVFPRVNAESILRSGWGLLTDQLYTVGGVQHLQTDSVSLFSATSAPFHLEGENVGQLPVKFAVQPRALKVIVPTRVD